VGSLGFAGSFAVGWAAAGFVGSVVEFPWLTVTPLVKEQQQPVAMKFLAAAAVAAVDVAVAVIVVAVVVIVAAAAAVIVVAAAVIAAAAYSDSSLPSSLVDPYAPLDFVVLHSCWFGSEVGQAWKNQQSLGASAWLLTSQLCQTEPPLAHSLD